MLFHIVEDSQVILRSKGVWKQATLYHRNEELYAKHGSGFIGLRNGRGTTLSNVSWEAIDSKREWTVIKMGRLELVPIKEKTNDSSEQGNPSGDVPDQTNADKKSEPQRRKSWLK
jgi:hypothetical protein